MSKALLLVRVTLRNIRCISNGYHVPNFRLSPVRRVSARRPHSSVNGVKEKVVVKLNLNNKSRKELTYLAGKEFFSCPFLSFSANFPTAYLQRPTVSAGKTFERD